MKVKLKTLSGEYPKYETSGASGMDICAYITEDIVIKPGDIVLVPTGLFIEIPSGYEAQIRARSGLSFKHGITMINGIGTIDSDYRGEIKVPLINLGKKEYIVKNGDRIAQMVIASFEKVSWEITEEINETKRGSGGFGHTGV